MGLIATEPGTAATDHRFRVIDPANRDIVMTVSASERDTNRIEGEMVRPGARTPLWAEFRDALVIEDRAPLTPELRAKVGFWRRILTWRPGPHEVRRSSRTWDLPTGDLGGANSSVVGIALLGGCAAVIAAQMYGVFVWLFLGYAIYLVGVFLVYRGLRRVSIGAPWRVRLSIGLPILVVALIGFAARGMIHPSFAWSNALLFFSQ